MEYSFLSQDKFNQIVEEHVKSLSKSNKSVVTEETAQQVIDQMGGKFLDTNVNGRNICTRK